MNQTKFDDRHPGQLKLDEFLTEDALKLMQCTSNNISPNFFSTPGLEKGQPHWDAFNNVVNDQAFGADLNFTDDSFLRIFDDIIDIPDILANEKQQNQLGGSPGVAMKDFRADANTGFPTMPNANQNSLITNVSENSIPIDNSHSSALQLNNGPKVPSKDTPFTMEKAHSPTSRIKPQQASEKEKVNSSTNLKENPSSLSTVSAPLCPKKKRRPRAKKVLTPAETLVVREKYLEKNRRAARKCRLKKKAEMAADQAKYDHYVSELRATKKQLEDSRKELLELIAVCNGMVGEGCGDGVIRRFVANWERREEACRGMLESGDMGVEAWKLVEKCRSARLGEGVLGDVGLDGGGEAVPFWQDSDAMGLKTQGSALANEVVMGHENTDAANATAAEDSCYISSGLTDCDETAPYSFCQNSPLTQQTQLPENPRQHSGQQLQSINWHHFVSSFQEPSASIPTAGLTNSNHSEASFQSPYSAAQATQSMSSPLTSSPTSPFQSHQEGPTVPTSLTISTSVANSPNSQSSPMSINKQNSQNLQRRSSSIKIAPRLRQESLDSGYGSICSTSTNHSHFNSLLINSASSSQNSSNTNSNCWSPSSYLCASDINPTSTLNDPRVNFTQENAEMHNINLPIICNINPKTNANQNYEEALSNSSLNPSSSSSSLGALVADSEFGYKTIADANMDTHTTAQTNSSNSPTTTTDDSSTSVIIVS
ncbi:5e804280-2342-465d-b52a-40335c097e60 [Sclerotinia trifoliorum]|uniref:5e804280-2342-465d-b52a-40335c097e60 n=1 Tax=Sclerotinia trifoliorum TaxID=28548 RepID=A0A8H2ZRM6_9HELO|nr:5e804280-2342-465d-b52a-40335c097e60 [Sclerotinia trifoliorum]